MSESVISVFVSYRREDTRHVAGRLADRLKEHFEVFIDTDTIEPGTDFIRAIRSEVTDCDVLLAVIGSRWATVTDTHGRRCLYNPDDWVVEEIRTALRRDIPVMPVLVDGATMPGPADLPPTLASLASRQALTLNHESFGSDSRWLISIIERVAAHAARTEVPPKQPAAAPGGPGGAGAERPTVLALSVGPTASRAGQNATAATGGAGGPRDLWAVPTIQHTKNRLLLGALAFLAAVVLQLAIGLVISAAAGQTLTSWAGGNARWAVTVLLAVATTLTALTMWYVASRSHRPVADAGAAEPILTELATAIGALLDNEPQLPVVNSALAIPVRWINADPALSDQWSNIRRDRRSAEPLDLHGVLEDIVDVFGGIPSHRLVVLGKAGAGKSILMLRFMRTMLDDRATTGVGHVPILLALATWDPTSISLTSWLERELSTQHPSLARRLESGKSLARVLVDGGRLIYLLDGLDEMPSTLRGEALTALSTSLRPSDRLIITCRTAEFRAAVTVNGPLADAAAVVLEDLQPDDIRAYLPFTRGDAAVGSPWSPVITAMETATPGSAGAAIRQAFRTPLMVHLARVVYQRPNSRPQELLDCRTPEQIESILLDRYLPAALDHGRTGQPRTRLMRRSESYLGFLAEHMVTAGTPYFRWWELHRALSVRARIAIGIAAGLIPMLLITVILFAIGLVYLMSDPSSVDTEFLWEEMLAVALWSAPAGLIVGLLVGRLVHPASVTDTDTPRIPVRLRRMRHGTHAARLRGRNSRRTRLLTLRLGLTVGAIGGIASNAPVLASGGLSYMFADAGALGIFLLFVLLYGAAYFLLFTSSVWAALRVSELIEEPVSLSEVWSPLALVRTDRRTALLEALLGGLAAVILSAVVAVPAFLLVSLGDMAEGDDFDFEISRDVLGVVALGPTMVILPVLAILLVSTAWGRFTVTRLYLASTRKLPIRLMKFLNAAHDKGILRQTGPAFQFRHLKLRDRLADTSPDTTNTSGGSGNPLEP